MLMVWLRRSAIYLTLSYDCLSVLRHIRGKFDDLARFLLAIESTRTGLRCLRPFRRLSTPSFNSSDTHYYLS